MRITKVGSKFVMLSIAFALAPCSVACSATPDQESGELETSQASLTSQDSFQIAYQGGYSYQGGSQIGSLALWGQANVDGYLKDLPSMMKPGTSPSITELAGNSGFMAAFQSNTTNNLLTLWGIIKAERSVVTTNFQVKSGTSPSIAGLTDGSYEVAVQGNDGKLWLYGSNYKGPTSYVLASGTNPSVTALPNGGYVIAVQGQDGQLWLYGTDAGPTGVYMSPGTSPSITTLQDGTYEIAVRDQNGKLSLYGKRFNGPTNYVMAPGTSPSITGLQSGNFEVAVQGQDGKLWLYGESYAGTGYVFASGTSPSITAVPGGYEVALQGQDGVLWIYGTQGSGTTYYKMAPGTNPSIIAVPPTPSAPTGLKYTTTTSSCTATNNLTWSSSNGAAKYVVMEGAPYYNNQFVNTTSSTWSNLPFSSSIAYSVAAYNANGSLSPYSSISTTTAKIPSGCVKNGWINMDLQFTSSGASCGSSSFYVDNNYMGSADGTNSGGTCHTQYNSLSATPGNHWVCAAWGSYCCKCQSVTSGKAANVILTGSDCIYPTYFRPTSCK